MRSSRIDTVTLILLGVFGITFFDAFLIAPTGARLLPLEYETVRALAVLSGLFAAAGATVVYRRRRASATGFLSAKVSLHIAIVLLLVPVALASVLGFFGAFSWFLDLLASFRLQYTALLGLGVASLLLLRRLKWAAVIGIFLGANCSALAPYVIAGNRGPVSSTGRSLRLVLVNVNSGNRSYDRLKSFLFEVNADVILLEEFNPLWNEALSDLDERYPQAVTAPLQGNFGIGLWTRLPLRSKDVVNLALNNVPSVVVTVDVDGTALQIVGTHPLPPRDAGNTKLRNEQLGRAADIAVRGGSHSILLGDFNTTPWGEAFRSVVDRSQLRDSGLGMGIQWTWPAGFWPLALPLDHCLVSEKVRVVDRWIGPDGGSDHFPLVVDVQLE
jgi:endonuclease/exonuclease/phosphatase (EEP) superfamily protein YafD